MWFDNISSTESNITPYEGGYDVDYDVDELCSLAEMAWEASMAEVAYLGGYDVPFDGCSDSRYYDEFSAAINGAKESAFPRTESGAIDMRWSA